MDDGASATALHIAAQLGFVSVMRCLVKELGADVNKPSEKNGCSPLHTAARVGYAEGVRCMVEELGANVNQADHYSLTPPMAASRGKHKLIAKYLIKHGADPQASAPAYGAAADMSQLMVAPAHHTAYFEAKVHCANPNCGGAGLWKCTRCKKARYCSQQCQLAHWPAHKVERV
jgi:hypothetical protein